MGLNIARMQYTGLVERRLDFRGGGGDYGRGITRSLNNLDLTNYPSGLYPMVGFYIGCSTRCIGTRCIAFSDSVSFLNSKS